MNERKTRVARIVFLAICLTAICLACCSCAFGKTSLSTNDSSVAATVKAAEPVSGDIVNPVILICFADESVEATRASFSTTVRNYFVGEENSLEDYYRTISYGQIDIETLFPESDDEVFIFRAPRIRSYYKSIKESASNAKRSSAESELLNAAIKAAAEYFDFSGYDLDKNDDGYVDSVSFLVSGGDDDGSGWGGLLWPHSWELATISTTAGTSAEKLGAVAVNKFSFNFIETVDVGFLCHETGHVFGMPDLYHYKYDTDYVQVSEWDIMHLNESTPQYPTVHLRDKYLGCIGDNQIIDLKTDGTYTLKPVSIATAEDTVAYRLKLNDNESVYFEYRSKNVATYDSMLPGSGLIVYRVYASVDGNTNGKKKSSVYPDEVYVYRPSVASTGTTKAKEKTNLSYAYLSDDNPYFSTLGSQTGTKKYDVGNIFTTDGSNTGVIVKVTDRTDEEITFEININGLGSDKVKDIVVEGEPTINYGEVPEVRVKVLLSGRTEYVVASPDKYVVEYNPERIGEQIATIAYTDEDGETIRYNFTLTINDPLETESLNVVSGPDVTIYEAGEEIKLDGLVVAVTYKKQGVKEIAYSDTSPSLWSIEGVDSTSSGVYEAVVTYQPFGLSITIEIKIVSDLVAISIAEKNSSTIVSRTGSLSLTVTGTYEDGTERTLSPTEYTISGFSKSKLYEKQNLTIVSSENNAVWCSKTVIVVDETELIAINQLGKIKTMYMYGESLDLSGGQLEFDFGDNKFVVSAENYYEEYRNKFLSTKKGKQELVVSIFGVSNGYSVYVASSDGSALASGSSAVSVNHSSGYVLFSRATLLSEGAEALSSYLNIRFVRTDGIVKYEIKPSLASGVYVSSSMRIELVDDDGSTIMVFRIYVKGDADGDGRVTDSDKTCWAELLYKQKAEADIYLDMDGDGDYSLTDYVLLMDAYGGESL